MPIKKSQLYSSLWKSCDELRGGMDASQYKDYVLVLLFIKYVSDKFSGRAGELTVPPGAGFGALVKLKGKDGIGEGINKVIEALAKANDLAGIITLADFDDDEKLGKGKAKIDRLSKLIGIFENPALDFSGHHSDSDDILGDAYEYLMRHFATESGKSKGQFYTPAEVSRVMARMLGLERARQAGQVLYDPTCGSGSLLIKAFEEARHRSGVELTVYGQEMDNATRALAMMNMLLHGVTTAQIAQDNTLATPSFTSGTHGLLQCDYVVANPPFSMKAWTSGMDPEKDPFNRFHIGVPPEKNGDYAFLLHILASLKSTGTGAIVLPHGVLFRGHAEAKIRRALLERGVIKAIVGLPPNLFYGTGIPACILVIDKLGAGPEREILMIDASRDFMKDGPKNRLRARDIHKIVDVYTRGLELPRYSRRVPWSELKDNDFNLNLPRYVDSAEPADEHDLQAHLSGGLPAADLARLQPHWEALPGLRAALLEPTGRAGYERLRVSVAKVSEATRQHTAWRSLSAQVTATLDVWLAVWRPQMLSLRTGQRPKRFVESMSEALLEAFRPTPLIDAYAVYQGLMDLCDASMMDDVDWVCREGWCVVKDNEVNMDFVPRETLIARFFATEQAALDAISAEAERLSAEIAALDEEHGEEDGLLASAKRLTGKLTLKAVKSRMDVLSVYGGAEAGEAAMLKRALALLKDQKKARDQEAEQYLDLERKVTKRYRSLSEAEVKALVVDDRWVHQLRARVDGASQRALHELVERLRTVGERYDTPLPTLEADVAACSERVQAHLHKMGVVWG